MAYGNDEFAPILLGTGVNAYNIARCLHEVHGIRSLALGRVALRETSHSRILDVRAYREFNDPAGIVRILNELAAELPQPKLLLFATIEFYTNVLGLTVRTDRPNFPFGGAWLDLGGQQVHLIEAEVPPARGQHFAIHVADLD